jgi:hypothetical protein
MTYNDVNRRGVPTPIGELSFDLPSGEGAILDAYSQHCRADTEIPGFVARGRHDAALAGSANSHRLAAQVRIVPLLYRCTERMSTWMILR